MKTPPQSFVWPSIGLVLLFLIPFLGSESIAISEILEPESFGYRIFWDLRIPRFLFALSLGGLLSTIGGTYQLVFRNPLCEPYILGISSAVLLGMVVGELVFGQIQILNFQFLISVCFALALILALILFSSARPKKNDRLVLFGVGANFFLSSFLFLLLSVQSQSVGGGTLKWFFGFLPWPHLSSALIFLGVATLSLGILLLFSRFLEALTLGDLVAKTLGVDAMKTRNWVLLGTSVILTIAVLQSGTIGFVGLVVPLFCRYCFRPRNHRLLMLQSFGVGALFLAIADGLSRSLFPPHEFPVGILTTLLGGPFFLWALWKKT